MCFVFINTSKAQLNQTISLNSDWQLLSTTTLTPPEITDLGRNMSSNDIFNTQLPNNIFKILWENSAIEEEVSKRNASRLQWLKEKDWLFQRVFDMDAANLNAAKINLILKGVDTYAAVFINGNLVFNTDDSSKTWSADIKKYMTPKANLLSVNFAAKPIDAKASQKPVEKNTNPNQYMQSSGIQSVDLTYIYGSDKEEIPATSKPITVTAKSIKQPETIPAAPPTQADIKMNEKLKNTASDVTWEYSIDNDMFKLTVINDRSNKALGYFFLDVYDAKGNQLYVDMRFMSVEAGSALAFYQQNLKTFLQGHALDDIEIVLRWRDEANKPQEIKRAFHLAPSKRGNVE